MRSAEYETMYREEDRHWWYVSLHELILAYVPQNKPGQRILDVGCGTGRLLQLLQSRGTVVGCDVSAFAVHFCFKRGMRALWSDLNRCSFEKGRYDIVTQIDVLYHRAIKDDKAVLRKLYEVLKPGGRLIFQVPAYQWLRSSHDDAVHTGRRYTRKQVVRMVRACGFSVEKATYRVSLLFVPIALIRVARKMVSPGRGSGDDGASDVRTHTPIVNAMLSAVMKTENRLLKYFSFPFGTSVFLAARKPGSPSEKI